MSADLLRTPPASPAGPTRPAGGRGYLVVGGSRANLRVHRRSAIVGVLLLVALVVTAAVSMITGDFPITLDRVLATLAGNGDSGEDFIVWTLRMPRLLLAVLIGAALAVAGGLFQSLTRNPLGSPDVIGFQAGSATGALLVILVWHGSSGQVSLGAIVGGLVTAALIYLLAMKGGLHGFRLILVGIGMAAMLTAANDYLITRAKLIEAQDAAVWLTGSLNAAAWDQVLPLGWWSWRCSRSPCGRRETCGCSNSGTTWPGPWGSPAPAPGRSPWWSPSDWRPRPPRPPDRWCSSRWPHRRSPGVWSESRGRRCCRRR